MRIDIFEYCITLPLKPYIYLVTRSIPIEQPRTYSASSYLSTNQRPVAPIS